MALSLQHYLPVQVYLITIVFTICALFQSVTYTLVNNARLFKENYINFPVQNSSRSSLVSFSGIPKAHPKYEQQP